MAQSVLILAAHPDDEVLGCGGTIAKMADGGARIHVAFLADGISSRDGDGAARRSSLHVVLRRKRHHRFLVWRRFLLEISQITAWTPWRFSI